MQIIKSKNAPEAIGPYSQAIKVNNMIFLSGQLGIDPKTGKFIGEKTEEQAGQILKNIENILKDADFSINNIVDVTVFLTDLSDFKKFNEVYASFFGEHKPARTTIQVAGLPLGAKIEIKVVGIK